jgi:predicted ATPase
MHDAHAMSDGTLRALAVLAAVWQVYFTHTDAGFVGFEEPETALHPAAVHALVDALDEATLRTQVLFTTHSPDLLDCPAVGPENVRVVEMIDGRTVIAPVDAAGVELVRRKLNTLGGLEREGQLAPDMTDVHRQRREAGASPA